MKKLLTAPTLSAFVLILALALGGCGRKEAPQPIAEEAPPVITAISHTMAGNVLKIEMKISGGSYGLGYQIDRAEIDPYCKCPGFWRRYQEQQPTKENLDKENFSELIPLRAPDVEFAFRVRAIDALGRFSEWSRVIRAKADPEAFRN